MFKVLIVDDDILVRVGIKSFIQWEQLGLILVGEASNGKEALELIETESPDIVLLDIRMPDMNGIDLLKEMEQRQIKTQVIVLSCYSDYEYVREAMKLGAVDYILKLSLKPDELTSILLKVRNLLLEKASGKEAIKRENILDEYIIKKIENKKNNKEYINNQQINSFISNIDAGNNFLCTVNSTQEQNGKNYLVNNIIKEVLRESDSIYIIDYPQILILFTRVVNSSEVYEIIERIVSVLKSYVSLDICVGISSAFIGVDSLNEAYLQCIHSINYSFYYENRNVILYDETRRFLDNNNLLNKEIYSDLSKYIESMNLEETRNVINLLFDKIIEEKSASPDVVKDGIIEIINIFSNLLKSYYSSFSDMRILSPYSEIMKKSNIYQLRQWFDSFITEFYNFTKQILGNKFREEIMKAKEYIIENYNKDIDLSMVAKFVNQSENYFSYMFKKETGENFIDYLNNIRIKKAKELLLNHDYKVYEVADIVGYNSISYFIKIFKKTAGCSPNEYKKQISGG